MDDDRPYRDRKRYAWLLSLVVPALVGAGPALYLWSGKVWHLWLPIIFVYVVVPIFDLIFADDQSNPPESAVPELENDRYYRYITYAAVPLLWIAFTFGVWFVARHPLPWYGVLAVILTTGLVGGFGINLGHELGHKQTGLERWLAKIILAPTGYGHFYIEHNRGHHRDVATPDDPASARMGESIFAFLVREMPGALRRAWGLERERLARLNTPAWSLENEIVQPLLITVTYWTVLCLWLGVGILPVILLASFWANFQLTTANYIEHYGLRRRVLANGRPELCQPHHSWNSNHLFSNWALFHLQRHSDHHAHPVRRYQSLRHFDELPQLPSGYFGMYIFAYLPPLWFKVMDPRLLDAVGRDPGRINFDPAREAALKKQYRLEHEVSWVSPKS